MENSRLVFGAVAAVWVSIVGYKISNTPGWRRRRLYHSWWKREEVNNITIVGDIFCDIIATGLGEFLPSWGCDLVVPNPISIRAGGSGLNTAVWISALGLDSPTRRVGVRIPRTFAQLGREPRELLPFTAGIEDTLIENGVEIIDPEDRYEGGTIDWGTGTCVCISGVSDRSFITYQGGNGLFTYSDFLAEKLVPKKSTRHLHIAGYYNCSGIWGEASEVFIEKCRADGVKTISLNPQYGKGWGRGIERLIGKVDFFICNATEAMGITGCTDLVDAINKIVDEYYCPCAIVTMGSEGALVRQKKIYPMTVLGGGGATKEQVRAL